MLRIAPTTKGEFREVEHGRWFTYHDLPKDDPCYEQAISQGLDCLLDVLDGTRYARVMKTVAYVAVDEHLDGSFVLERWKIDQHYKHANEQQLQ